MTPQQSTVRRPLSASYRRLLMSAAACLCAAGLNAQSLISHYTLDGDGTDSGSLGFDGAPSGSAAYGASGSGVGIFDKALSTADGTNDFFAAPVSGTSPFALNAITISLWVNIDSAASTDRLISNITASSGFDLFIANYSAGTGAGGADGFRLTFGINGTGGGNGVSSDDAQYVTDKWLFIAVTYDGANVNFYSGSEATSLILNDTVAKTGSIASSSSALEIGGTPVTGNDRSPTALFNDVRIYDGALTLAQLEALRADVVAVPEPSQYALLFGAASLGFIALRRHRRLA